MSGESHEIKLILRYLQELNRGHAVSLADEFEASALADAWNDSHPERPAVVTVLLDGRHVVSVDE